MNNRFIHLIYIPCTGVGIRPFRGQDWFKYRIEILKKYTLNSLINQTNRRFILWLSFRPEEMNNPLTIELEQYLKEKNIMTIMTFNGLMYWDDKFNQGYKEKLMNFARVVRMAYQDNNPSAVNTPTAFVKMLLTQKPPVNFSWRQAMKALFEDKNKTLKDRLTIALNSIHKNLQGDFEWVYVSRIDSDDMFHQDFVQEVQTMPPYPGATTCRNGYVYNSNTGQLAEWRPSTNPPFHTIMFPKETFFDPARYIQYFKGFRSHEDIPNVFHSQNLKDGRYCVLIHQKHISTIWEHPWKGKEIEGTEKEDILNDFGIGGKKYFRMDDHKLTIPSAEETNLAIREIVDDYKAHGKRLWEPATTAVVKERVKPGDICVDIGASLGYFTLLMARQTGKDGLVMAFEPTHNQFAYLNKNVELNGYKDIVKTYNMAAWDEEGEQQFERMKNIHINAGVDKPMEGVVLDSILPKKVDFIKMDIDGSEPRALKGLIKTFENNPQLQMVIEYYPKCIEELGNDPKEMIAILDKYFTYEQIPGDYGNGYWNYICKRK